jgi:hypothetical protein
MQFQGKDCGYAYGIQPNSMLKNPNNLPTEALLWLPKIEFKILII